MNSMVQLAAIVLGRWNSEVGGQGTSYRRPKTASLFCGEFEFRKHCEGMTSLKDPSSTFSAACCSNTAVLCSVKATCEYTRHSRKSRRCTALGYAVVLPHTELYLFLLKVLIISTAFLLLCQWSATFLSPNKCCLTPIEQSKCESQWMEQPQ